MRKFTPALLLAAAIILAAPFTAFAHNGGDKDGNERNNDNGVRRLGMVRHLKDNDDDNDHDNRFEKDFRFENNFRFGTVTAIGSNQLTLKTAKGVTVTVDTSDAKITLPFGAAINLSDVKVNDHAMVRGNVGATTDNSVSIDATSVVIIPENTRPRAVKGTVTAVTDDSVTIQTKHDQTVTVQTDNDTTVTNKDGSSATTDDIEVGDRVKVKGLWDRVLDVFRAIKIRFK